jgi:hypothetical protein
MRTDMNKSWAEGNPSGRDGILTQP